jgi:hypothetical protein
MARALIIFFNCTRAMKLFIRADSTLGTFIRVSWSSQQWEQLRKIHPRFSLCVYVTIIEDLRATPVPEVTSMNKLAQVSALNVTIQRVGSGTFLVKPRAFIASYEAKEATRSKNRL